MDRRYELPGRRRRGTATVLRHRGNGTRVLGNLNPLDKSPGVRLRTSPSLGKFLGGFKRWRAIVGDIEGQVLHVVRCYRIVVEIVRHRGCHRVLQEFEQPGPA